MAFWSRFIGSNDPLAAIRKSFGRGEWADVLARIASLHQDGLSEHDKQELKAMHEEAAGRLAQINFEEGLACLQTEDVRRGVEHLELARQLTQDEKLKRQIEHHLVDLGSLSRETLSAPEPATQGPSCSSSCCDSVSLPMESEAGEALDEETQFELILTAYPPQEREKYRALSPVLRKAVLLAHAEESDDAIDMFSRVSEEDRGDIYCYECGALFGRVGRYQDAVALLTSALQKNAGHVLAATTLVELYLSQGELAAAEKLLQAMLAAGWLPDYCHARLAVVCQSRGDVDLALSHAQTALQCGCREQQLIVFVAGSLEAEGKLDEAEQMLQSIPVSGGCSGGANVELAEFWLRHNKKLHQSLEMFKKAGKTDPGNPIWGFNIARVYLALGWKKDARSILENLAASEMVSESLRNEASQLLRTSLVSG